MKFNGVNCIKGFYSLLAPILKNKISQAFPKLGPSLRGAIEAHARGQPCDREARH
jgi:hypothetical protein